MIWKFVHRRADLRLRNWPATHSHEVAVLPDQLGLVWPFVGNQRRLNQLSVAGNLHVKPLSRLGRREHNALLGISRYCHKGIIPPAAPICKLPPPPTGSNSHYGPIAPRRVPSPGVPISAIMRTAARLDRAGRTTDFFGVGGRLSLTPRFSEVGVAREPAPQPLQRFTVAGKPLKRFRRRDHRPHPTQVGC